MRATPTQQQPSQPALETAWVEEAESTPAPSRKRAIIVVIVTLLTLIASGVAMWVWSAPERKTPAPQPTATATQTTRTYTASDYEENRETCREMYESRDLQLYWSCVVGDIRLGQETAPAVPLTDLPPVRLAPKASLGGRTDIAFAPDATARCYATGYCFTDATFNNGQTSVQVMFTRGDGDIMGIFVPTQDAPTVMTKEVLAPYMPTGAAPDPTVHQATLSRIHMGASTLVGYVFSQPRYCGDTPDECTAKYKARTTVPFTGTTHITTQAEAMK